MVPEVVGGEMDGASPHRHHPHLYQANAILLTLLTCWGRGMQTWQYLVLIGRG